MSNKSNIECFNDVYRSFLKEIAETFSGYKLTIIQRYEDLLNNTNPTDDTYVREYMSSVQNHIDKITVCDDALFTCDEPLYFLREVDFRYVWKQKMTDTTKTQIRKYLKTLYVIGAKITSLSTDIDKIISEFTNKEQSGNTDTNSETDLSAETKRVANILESISTDDVNNDDMKEQYEKMMEESSIGKLAKEIAGEINFDSLDLDNVENPGDIMSKLMGGDFMSIVQNVGTKIKNKISSGDIDSGALLGEAQQMISMMGANNQLGEMLKNFGGLGQSQTPNQGPTPSTRKMERTANRVSSRTTNSSNSSNSRSSRAKERLRKKLDERKNKNKNKK